MDIQTKDGILLRGIPDGTPDEEIKTRLQKIRSQGAVNPPSGGSPNSAASEATPAELIAGSLPGRIVLGAGNVLAAPLQIGANIGDKISEKIGSEPVVGKFLNKNMADLDDIKKRGMAAYNNEGFDWGGLLGSVAGVSAAVPKLAAATTLPAKIAQGMKVGAFSGAATPVTNSDDNFFENKAAQTALGAVVGGVIPAAVEGAKFLGKGAYKLAEPFLPSGPGDILKRFHEKLVGSGKQEVIKALKEAKPFVPGSNPTAAEAIANIPQATGLAAHQKVISKTPGISGDFMTRQQAQEGARKAAIGEIAGTKDALSAAEGQRAANALKDYGTAYQNKIKMTPELAQMAKNPYFAEALPDATKLAAANGVNPKENLTQFLHYVKLSLDKQLGKTGDTALSNSEKQAVQNVKTQLIEWMGKKNPAYEAARSNFEFASKPINQMEVGQLLEGKLTAPLGNVERAASFAQAARDAPTTLKKSTGFNRYDKLDQVLKPEQVKVVDAIVADLQRKAKSDVLAKGTNLTGGADGVRGDTVMGFPQLLSRPVSIANWVLKLLGKGNASVNDKIHALAGRQYLNPQILAESLKDVPPSKRQIIIHAIMQKMRVPLTVAAPISATQQQGGN